MKSIVLILVFGMAVPPAASQTPAKKPAFEVAAIKPSTDESGPAGISRTSTEFVTTGLSIPFLIRWAWDLDEDRLVGTPKGLDSIKFDIVARIPQDENLIPNVT